MKILIISQYWWPENGVPQRRWTWLSQILVDAGHEVTVIAPPPHYQRTMTLRDWWENRRYRSAVEEDRGPSGEYIVRSGFLPSGRSLTQRVINQATVALGALWVIARKPGKLRNYSPDVVIGTVPALPTAVVTTLTARRFRAPYIIDLRDAWPDLLAESDQWNRSTGQPSLREKVLSRGPLQIVSKLTEFLVNRSMRGASGLIVTSSRLKDDTVRRKVLQRNGVAPPTTVVRNVFPPETKIIAKRPANTGSCKLNVLYAGTLGRAQNLVNAVLAAKKARELGVDVRLRFVGAGAAKNELQRVSRELGIEVEFISRHPADALDEHYEWANTALVHLTDWPALKHAVPSKTYELMTIGLHITAVASGEAAEIVRDLRAGVVVNPEAPAEIARVWSEIAGDQDRLQVSDAGRKWVREQREVVAPRHLLEIIETAVSG